MLTEGGRFANIFSLYGFACIKFGDYLRVETILKQLTCEARKLCEANNRLTNRIGRSGGVSTSVAQRARIRRICISSVQMSADARISQKGRGRDYPQRSVG